MRVSAWRHLAAIVLCLAIVPDAHAIFRAYLSSTGSDANPCTLPAPCRLLPAALAAVDDGGEIWMLSSANYNSATVDVTKSVTILAVPGVVGSVVATGGPGISVSTAGIAVTLRNLVIVPFGAGPTDGVSLTASSVVTVDGSSISRLSNGVVASAGLAVVSNSTLSTNANYGVQATGSGQVAVTNSRLIGNGQGGILVSAAADSVASGTLSDSYVFGGSSGAQAFADAANAVSRLTVTRSTIDTTTNGVGATAPNGTAVTFMGATTVANSGNVVVQSGANGLLVSHGNNQSSNSGAPVGTVTPAGTF